MEQQRNMELDNRVTVHASSCRKQSISQHRYIGGVQGQDHNKRGEGEVYDQNGEPAISVLHYSKGTIVPLSEACQSTRQFPRMWVGTSSQWAFVYAVASTGNQLRNPFCLCTDSLTGISHLLLCLHYVSSLFIYVRMSALDWPDAAEIHILSFFICKMGRRYLACTLKAGLWDFHWGSHCCIPPSSPILLSGDIICHWAVCSSKIITDQKSQGFDSKPILDTGLLWCFRQVTYRWLKQRLWV